MKIGITGSNGFLGFHVSRYFSSLGFSINIIKHEEEASESLENKLTGIDCLIHLAGVNRAAPEEIVSGNAVFTTKVMECLKKISPYTKVLFASSSQVYLENSLYGISKRYAEEIIQMYARDIGIKAVILRFSNLYGPFARPHYNSIIATYIKEALLGNTVTVHGTGEQTRDFLYVDDATAAIEKAMNYNSENASSTFDVATNTQVSINKLIETIKAVSGKDIRIKYEGKDTSDGVTRKIEAPMDIHKLSWKPRTTLENGIAEILRIEYGDNAQNN